MRQIQQYTMTWKGKRSKEWKENLSKIMKGKKPSEATIKGYKKFRKDNPKFSPTKGMTHSEESKENMSLAHIGQVAWNKGKKLSPEQKENTIKAIKKRDGFFKKGNKVNKGRPHTEEWKKEQSERSKKMWKDKKYRKKVTSKMMGHKVSAETRDLISKSRLGDKHWTTRLPYTKEHKAKLREKRLHQVFPVKDTKIEIKTQEYLTEKGVLFQTHKPIIGQPDIFIKPEKYAEHNGYCVMVDGCYFHGCDLCHPNNFDDIIPAKACRRDLNVDRELKSLNYTVIRILEHEINANDFSKLDNILKAVNRSTGF